MSPAVPLAIVLDAIVGDPDALWRRVPHPVALMGRVIAALDRRLNRGRRRDGVLALALLLAASVVPAAALDAMLGEGVAGLLVEAALASTLIAHRSLHVHVSRIAAAPTLVEARAALSMIVGRETAALGEAGVAAAALESLGESFCDGVAAPLFWYAVAGLPGLVAYKAVNTADSMIGHRTPRHERFGFAAARLDDALNLVPARASAVLILLTRPQRFAAAPTLMREARAHVSPNAGWPEAALAHVLGVRLGGPRRYGERHVAGAVLNAAGRAPAMADIRRGLRVSAATGVLQFLAYAGLAAAL